MQQNPAVILRQFNYSKNCFIVLIPVLQTCCDVTMMDGVTGKYFNSNLADYTRG